MKYLWLLVALAAVGCTNPVAAEGEPVKNCWDCKNRLYDTLPSGERIWTCAPETWVATECRLVPDYLTTHH